MRDKLVFPYNTKYFDASPASRLLGTASWQSSTSLTAFEPGHFWLGRTDDDDAVGLKNDRHVLICAGSRGGKGVSFIVPTLSTWPGSAVVIDPKGENAVVTARRRATGSRWAEGLGQRVHILDPFNIVKTAVDDFANLKASFNPIDALRTDDPESVERAYAIAETFIPGEAGKDPFFDDAAKELVGNIMLHVASAPEISFHDRNLLTVRRLIMAGDQALAKIFRAAKPSQELPSAHALLFDAMRENPAFDGVISRTGASLVDLEKTSPRLFSSIVQVAKTNTRFLDGEGMHRVLSKSSFFLDDLKTNPFGTTVFVCLPQRAMETHYRWLRMMVALTTVEMERVPQQPASGHPVLMILDEFPSLRRMRVLENAAAQIAGYGVKLAVVCQTLAQLKDLYRDNWETFVANAGTKLFSCNDDHFTREYVSKLIGECEIIRELPTVSQSISRSETYSRGGSTTQSSSTSTSYSLNAYTYGCNSGHSETENYNQSESESASITRGCSTSIFKRPLLAPDEVGRMFGDPNDPRALVLLSGHQPISVKRSAYFSDYSFLGKVGWHPDHNVPLDLPEALTKKNKVLQRRRQERQKRKQELETAADPYGLPLPEKKELNPVLEFFALLAIGATAMTLGYFLYHATRMTG